MDVKPWEPVKFGFNRWNSYSWKSDRGDRACTNEVIGRLRAVCLNVTLANGQRIIVRALAEERKAARAFKRRVNKAVEANR